jgi:hypothetical protein
MMARPVLMARQGLICPPRVSPLGTLIRRDSKAAWAVSSTIKSEHNLYFNSEQGRPAWVTRTRTSISGKSTDGKRQTTAPSSCRVPRISERCTARPQQAAPIDSAAGEVAVVPGTPAVGVQPRPETASNLFLKKQAARPTTGRHRARSQGQKKKGGHVPASRGSDSRLSRQPALCDRGTRSRGRPPDSLRAPRRAKSTTTDAPEGQRLKAVVLRRDPLTGVLSKLLLPLKVGRGSR